MSSKANIAIPPCAGLLVYKAYKSGNFETLKDKIFNHNFDDAGEGIENPMAENLNTNHGSAMLGVSAIPIEEADTIHGLHVQSSHNI